MNLKKYHKHIKLKKKNFDIASLTKDFRTFNVTMT